MVSYQMRTVFLPEVAKWWRENSRLPLCLHCPKFLGGRERGMCTLLKAIVPVDFAVVCGNERLKYNNVTEINDAYNDDTALEGDSGRAEEAGNEGGDVRPDSEETNRSLQEV